jgi:uncharacterized membrane protein SpoIIM required for sporulation
MLPEIILREGNRDDFGLLILLGAASAVIGFNLGRFLFPSQSGIMTVVFASLPLVYPLTDQFLSDEKEGRPHREEVEIYGSLFVGEVLGFSVLGFVNPAPFESQFSVIGEQLVQMGITGYATSSASFLPIFLNNMTVFMVILGVSIIIGSAGAFILTWNASVLGVFMGTLARELPTSGLFTGSGTIPTPIAYLPHSAFEMSGFIIAGISGSLMSAAIYREHLDWNTWKDFFKLAGFGIVCIFFGAGIETL